MAERRLPLEGLRVVAKSEEQGVAAIGRDAKLVDAAHMRPGANVLYKASLAEPPPRQT